MSANKQVKKAKLIITTSTLLKFNNHTSSLTYNWEKF